MDSKQGFQTLINCLQAGENVRLNKAGEAILWAHKEIDQLRTNLDGHEVANDLLRSAYSIALREGRRTNWPAFLAQLHDALLDQAGVPDTTGEQLILRATCTAKTFSSIPDDEGDRGIYGHTAEALDYKPLFNVTKLRQYTNKEDVNHVMYERQEIEQLYHCPVCGDLQVISGTIWHTKPIEDHPDE